MKAIPIKVVADICGVEPKTVLNLVRAEMLDRTGKGEWGKVKLSDTVVALNLTWDEATCTFVVKEAE